MYGGDEQTESHMILLPNDMSAFEQCDESVKTSFTCSVRFGWNRLFGGKPTSNSNGMLLCTFVKKFLQIRFFANRYKERVCL